MKIMCNKEKEKILAIHYPMKIPPNVTSILQGFLRIHKRLTTTMLFFRNTSSWKNLDKERMAVCSSAVKNPKTASMQLKKLESNNSISLS